jgi:predicted O-linked N-acetylglucosamine transferase (SPINDLY family)
MEQFCAQYADEFVQLPAGLSAQVRALREANLDLVYLGNNVTPTARELTPLALHRLARIQVAGVCSCVTTGMRNVDCYLSGRLSEPNDAQSHYTEKLYMIDGPAHCYDFGAFAPAVPTQKLRREDFGISRDAIVFASGANFFKILPELEDVWLRILSSIPDAYLLLYPFGPQWAKGYPISAFMTRLATGLRRYGIHPQRLLVFKTASDRSEILQRLTLADVYLDSFPFSGATSLLDPLLVGLAPITMDGTSFRSLVGPAILRSLGLDQLVVDGVSSYIALAQRLAVERQYRESLSTQIRRLMGDNPLIFDGPRYSAKVGCAFEQMWQDYCDGRLKTY